MWVTASTYILTCINSSRKHDSSLFTSRWNLLLSFFFFFLFLPIHLPPFLLLFFSSSSFSFLHLFFSFNLLLGLHVTFSILICIFDSFYGFFPSPLLSSPPFPSLPSDSLIHLWHIYKIISLNANEKEFDSFRLGKRSIPARNNINFNIIIICGIWEHEILWLPNRMKITSIRRTFQFWFWCACDWHFNFKSIFQLLFFMKKK